MTLYGGHNHPDQRFIPVLTLCHAERLAIVWYDCQGLVVYLVKDTHVAKGPRITQSSQKSHEHPVLAPQDV